jgi:hypothetical protein
MQKVEQPYFVVASRIQQFSKGADFRWLDARFFQSGLGADSSLDSSSSAAHLRFLCGDPVADHLMAWATGLPAQSVGLCRGTLDVCEFVGVALSC